MTQPPKLSKGKFLLFAVASQVIPAGLGLFLSLYLIPHSTFKFEYALPLTVLWSALGAAIHYSSLKRGMRFRWMMTGVLAVATLGLGFGLTKAFAIDHSQLKTCAVCGFVALPAYGEACPICHVAFRGEDAAKEGYDSAQDYLIAAQTMHFMPVAPDTTIDFHADCNCTQGYLRDPQWQPSVSKKDILEVQAMTIGQ